jgi:rhodanese-related sulfurtransferase
MVTRSGSVSHHGILKKLGLASALAAGLLSVVLLAQEAAPTKGTGANLENGGRLYGMHCLQCHGPDGEDLRCQEIVPLAGLGRRPRVGLVGDVLSPSYFFRGVAYRGADARDLAAFLLSLKGEKGFEDPGLRCAPRLLRRRYGFSGAYRVIDVRSAAAYAKGHIPNAVSWPADEEPSERQPPAAGVVNQKLGLFAVRPAMSIVIYDDAVTPRAAQLWWNLVDAGHRNVAILDGGLRGWADEEGYLTAGVTRLAPGACVPLQWAELAAVRADADYRVLHLKAGTSEPTPGVFDWERTLNEGQLRTAAEIREYLEHCEIRLPGTYRVEGSDAEAAYLVYLLRLLGDSGASYDPINKLLIAGIPRP